MLKLTQNTKTYEDCTAGYAVTLDKVYTVKELIDEILTRNEWGSLKIHLDEQSWLEDTILKIEYKEDKLSVKPPSNILTRKVNNVKARGGWRSMDYIIMLNPTL